MSWDAYMTIDTGGESPAVVENIRNVTYNNDALFRALGAHPSDLEGKSGQEAAPVIIQAINEWHSQARRAELQKLEPANGWGGLADVKDFLEKALEACKKHPKAFLHFA